LHLSDGFYNKPRHTNIRQYFYEQEWLSLSTKSNPFEIIPLQTTGKEKNWKTEEKLERAAVTLETERIKGSNP